MRNQVMPWGRSLCTVTMKFSPVKIELKPRMNTPVTIDSTEVLVVGYQGEPYLRFLPEGGVLENRNAPTTYTNESRYGGDEIPAHASRTAEPDWVVLSDGHRWAWHDHRIHWMQRSRPLGLNAEGEALVADQRDERQQHQRNHGFDQGKSIGVVAFHRFTCPQRSWSFPGALHRCHGTPGSAPGTGSGSRHPGVWSH